MNKSQRSNIITLTTLELLERASYYGMRSIILLYAISQDGLNLNQSDTLGYSTWFTILVAIVGLPMMPTLRMNMVGITAFSYALFSPYSI